MAIARCKESAGKYRVKFTELGWRDEHMVEGGPMRVQLMQHEFDPSPEVRDGSPILDTREDFEGELCRHEVAWLNGFPGKNFNFKWRFDLEKMKRAKTSRTARKGS